MSIRTHRIQVPANDQTQEWLEQFQEKDRRIAQALLRRIHFVTADELSSKLRKVISESVPIGDSAALFVEQNPMKRSNKSVPMYKVPRRKKNRRSVCNGPAPVRPERNFKHDTGSEGVLATLLSGLARAEKDKFTYHPSMKQWRAKSLDHFIIVTDFIGSGQRIIQMLQSAWRVPTIRSWWSNKTIQFTIIAYSGTEEGIKVIQSHPSKPNVKVVLGCPKIEDQPPILRGLFKDLCKRYCFVRPKDNFTALGYGNTGGLLAFDHGAPNNMPLILHKSFKGWKPLFQLRSTSIVMSTVSENDTREEITIAFGRLRQRRLAISEAVLDAAPNTQQLILVLAALRTLPRNDSAVSARTGLPVDLVETVISRAKSAKLIDGERKLTDAAFREFEYLRQPRRKKNIPPLVNEAALDYVPQTLRSP